MSQYVHFMPVLEEEDPLQPLAEIRSHSNARVVWQRFLVWGTDMERADLPRLATEALVANVELQEFLKADPWPLSDCLPTFWPMHRHATWRQDNWRVVESIAGALNNRVFAYSNYFAPMALKLDPQERADVRKMLEQLGTWKGWILERGDEESCAVCNGLDQPWFTDWFHGIAWDWAMIVVWPMRRELGFVFITDTD